MSMYVSADKVYLEEVLAAQTESQTIQGGLKTICLACALQIYGTIAQSQEAQSWLAKAPRGRIVIEGRRCVRKTVCVCGCVSLSHTLSLNLSLSLSLSLFLSFSLSLSLSLSFFLSFSLCVCVCVCAYECDLHIFLSCTRACVCVCVCVSMCVWERSCSFPVNFMYFDNSPMRERERERERESVCVWVSECIFRFIHIYRYAYRT